MVRENFSKKEPFVLRLEGWEETVLPGTGKHKSSESGVSLMSSRSRMKGSRTIVRWSSRAFPGQIVLVACRPLFSKCNGKPVERFWQKSGMIKLPYLKKSPWVIYEESSIGAQYWKISGNKETRRWLWTWSRKDLTVVWARLVLMGADSSLWLALILGEQHIIKG